MIAPESAAVRHEKLVRRIVKRHFYGLTRFGYDIEDLVQEGLCAVIRAEHCYKPNKGAESTYYGRMAFNWLRSRIYTFNTVQKRVPPGACVSLDKPIGCDGSADTIASIVPSPVNVEQTAINRAMLYPALRRLKAEHPKQHTAVIMRFYGDYYGGEIAKRLGCSETYANYQVQYGLENLRKYMRVNTGGR